MSRPGAPCSLESVDKSRERTAVPQPPSREETPGGRGIWASSEEASRKTSGPRDPRKVFAARAAQWPRFHLTRALLHTHPLMALRPPCPRWGRLSCIPVTVQGDPLPTGDRTGGCLADVLGPISPSPYMSGTGNGPPAEGPQGRGEDGRAEQCHPRGQRSPCQPSRVPAGGCGLRAAGWAERGRGLH